MSTKQRANRVAFGSQYGKSRTRAETQIQRETKRVAQVLQARKKN